MSEAHPFADFYASELQGLWLLLVAPALFLAWRAVARSRSEGVSPPLAPFVARWCVVFAVLTLLDPIATGPLVKALGWTGGGATAVMLFFVLLGDFRIWWLVYHAAAPGPAALRRALVPTVAIAVSGYALFALAELVFVAVDGQVLWLLHESLFCATALLLRARWLPRAIDDAALRRFVGAVLGYAATYYALWASADLLLLAGLDLGWALRVVPNQLYYAFTVPFVWWRFFSRS